VTFRREYRIAENFAETTKVKAIASESFYERVTSLRACCSIRESIPGDAPTRIQNLFSRISPFNATIPRCILHGETSEGNIGRLKWSNRTERVKEHEKRERKGERADSVEKHRGGRRETGVTARAEVPIAGWIYI